MQPLERAIHDRHMRSKLRTLGVEPPRVQNAPSRPAIAEPEAGTRHDIAYLVTGRRHGDGDGPFVRYRNPVKVAHRDMLHVDEVFRYVRRDGHPTQHDDYEPIHRCARCTWPSPTVDIRFDELEVPASLRRTTVTGGDGELESVIARLRSCWPREEGLALAARKIRLLAPTEDLARIVVAGEAYGAAEEQKRSKDPAAYDSGKAKMLSNWLDDERWKDHRTPSAPTKLSRAYSITVVALGDRKWDPELDQGAEPTRAEKRQALDARHAEILAWDYQVDEWNKDYGPEPSTGEVAVIRTKQRKDAAA